MKTFPYPSWRRELSVLLVYLGLTLLLTYPLVLNFTTHVAGDGSDDPALTWNLWWVPYSLLHLDTGPIYTDYMFYPIGLNLGFYTLTYLNAFLALPLQFTFGLIPAANLNLLASFTLSGFGAYLLVSYLLRKQERAGGRAVAAFIPASAFVAGLLYAFSSNKFLYASLGQFNIASSQWIPFYILFLLKIFDTPKPPLRYSLLLGLFLLAQALAEFTFASFLILFTVAYLVYWLVTQRRLQSLFSNLLSPISSLLFASLVFMVGMSPILAAMFSDLRAEGDFIQQGLGFSNSFSADVLGFLIPSHLHPLFGALDSQFHFSYINFMYLGFTALALALVAVWRVKPARVWGIWLALTALLTLGPTLRINGAETDLPLPFDLLLEIPLIKGNRYPSRWSVMLTLMLAVMVGYGVWYLANRLSSSHPPEPRDARHKLVARGLVSVVGLLLIFEHLPIPLPLSDFRVPEIYSQIANDAGDFSVMEIPLAWRNGFRVTGSYRRDSQALPDRIFMFAQWYQATQRHPILNGNTSRNPELKFQYFSEAPVLNSLIALQEGHPLDDATRAQDRELAPRVLQFLRARYILWHTPIEQENRDVADKTRAYVEQIFPVTKMSESYENGRGVVAYRVHDLPADTGFDLKPDDPLARLYLGEGWGALGGSEFWAQRTEAKFFLPLTQPRNVQLVFEHVNSYYAIEQKLNARANGAPVGQADASSMRDGTITISIPAQTLHAGVNEITLEFATTALVPQERFAATIVVRSAGEEQGAFGHIYVMGRDESPNARGYNLVVINPDKFGEVEARANFDTFASEQESERMAEFIARVPDGRIVAVAASDEASYRLTQAGVDALKALGATIDLRNKFRWSHALIATKGAPQNAHEAASETRVSQLIQGAGLTEPTAAASIGSIRVELAP